MSQINIKLTDTPDPAPSGRRGIYISLAGQGRMVDSAGNTYAIVGEDGKEIELQTNATHIQWRYVGDPTWTDLVALSTITGPAGADGADGATGATGSAGADGKEVGLQVNGSDMLQWRYVGDPTWIDLFDLSTLSGGSSYQPAVERASNTILFDKDYIIGNAGARTGNILFDFTGAQLGATTRMLHSDASAFIFDTTATINTLFDSYNGVGNNAIFIQLVKLGATEAGHVIDVTLTAIP